MLNLYPQRETNPKYIDLTRNNEWHIENLQHISDVLITKQCTILVAWGNLIKFRSYLIDCLHKIVNITKRQQTHWVCLGKTKNGHPRHPLYVSGETLLIDFDMENYLNIC